jgi:hypothetical protein
MADDDAEKPWAERDWLEKSVDVVGGVIGGLFALAIVGLLIAAAVNETRWTFTRVQTEHVCKAGHHGDCLTRTPGVVKSVADTDFTVAIDRAPYSRHITSLTGPAPAVGTRVVTEDWHGRLVSIVDPVRGRRHTNQWPSPRRDALEALAAWAVLLLLPVLGLVFWVLERRGGRRSRAAGISSVPAQHARPS